MVIIKWRTELYTWETRADLIYLAKWHMMSEISWYVKWYSIPFIKHTKNQQWLFWFLHKIKWMSSTKILDRDDRWVRDLIYFHLTTQRPKRTQNVIKLIILMCIIQVKAKNAYFHSLSHYAMLTRYYNYCSFFFLTMQPFFTGWKRQTVVF